MPELHDASLAGHAAALQSLLALDAKTVNQRDPKGRTALWLAAWKGHLDCMELLLEAGADPALADDEGSGPIHLAALAGGDVGAAALERLIKAGISVDQPGKGRWRPLHYAAREGELAAVQTLLKHHADPNARTAIEETPLHWALYEGQEEAALALIEAGADINAQDEHGDTALHEAARFGYEDVARVLIEKQAQADLVNEFGETARAILAKSEWAFAAPFRDAGPGSGPGSGPVQP